jgi:integrase
MASRTRREDSEGVEAKLVYYKSRAVGVRWRHHNDSGEVSTGTTDRDEAIGYRAVLLAELKQGILPRVEQVGPGMRWTDFKRLYEQDYLATLSEGSQSAWTTASNWLDKLIKPRRLSDLNKASLSKFHGMLLAQKGKKRKDGKDGKPMSPSSAATYLRTIRAALGWGYDLDLIEHVPRLRLRKGKKRQATMRSRPICGEEFDRILAAVAEVRPNDTETWRRFLRGLSLSSLRVDELRRLSWDDSSDLQIDTTNDIPLIRMLAEGHKSGEDCFQPVTREFWELISSLPGPRVGPVFPLPGKYGQMTRKRVIRTVSAIGRAAGVITNSSTRKTATSHDIGRRTFLTKISRKLSMAETQAWARHSDPRTTSTYYIRHTAEELARAAGWAELQVDCSAQDNPDAVPG